MASTKKIPSTQQHLDIEDIRDDTIILKNGTASAVLQATAINFDLLNEGEQDAMIFAYAGLLNSLTYPIQILIRSKRTDVTNYLARLNSAKEGVENPKLVAQIEKYGGFIKELVSRSQVLDKRFYVIVPYFNFNLSQIAGGGVFHHRDQAVNKGQILERARVNLEPKIIHLSKQFARIGIRTLRLTTRELVELIYDLYNPEVSRDQKAALNPKEYTTPMVEPQIAPTAPEESSK